MGLKALGRYSDGAALHLHVRDGGTRMWVLRKMLAGKRVDFTLGPHPDLGLADARERARAWRRLIREGQDPRVVLRSCPTGFSNRPRQAAWGRR